MSHRIGKNKDNKPVSSLSNKALLNYSGTPKNMAKVRMEILKRGL